MTSLRLRIKAKDIRENLVRCLAARNSDDNSDARLRDEVGNLTVENAYGLLEILAADPKYQTDIALGIKRMKRKYSDMNPRVAKVIEHFDYAVNEGIEYPLDTIDGALGDLVDDVTLHLSVEQEHALILLEKSRYAADRPNRTPGTPPPPYNPFIQEAVIANPEQVGRIIAAVQKYDITHAAQLTSLLEGTAAPSLSEGAL